MTIMLKVAAELSVSIGDSPSEYDIGKSADSEGVERQMYPEDGALFTPTEVRWCLLVESAKVEEPEIE